MPNTFTKAERLCGKTSVNRLVSGGKWGIGEHLKYCVLDPGQGDCTRVLVSVPKRFFKRAVKRNLLKRRIREAYRKGKGALEGRKVDLLLQYNSPDIVDYSVITTEIDRILSEI